MVRSRFRRRGVLGSHQNILSINFGNTREGLYKDATNRNLNERHCGGFSKDVLLRLLYLKLGPQLVGAVWGSLGGATLQEEVYYWG